MPKLKFPKPDHPLPPPPERPWGTGSIELRSNGYLARWRDLTGKQASKLFRTPEEAGAHLDVIYPKGAKRIGRTDLLAMTARWRQTAVICDPPTPPVPPEEETEAMRVSALIRRATAQALCACASDLENLIGIG